MGNGLVQRDMVGPLNKNGLKNFNLSGNMTISLVSHRCGSNLAQVICEKNTQTFVY